MGIKNHSMSMPSAVSVFFLLFGSESGEDGILEEIFNVIETEEDEKWVVEFGAWDGVHLSNSWNLIQNHNWKGVLIEANKEKFLEMERYQIVLSPCADLNKIGIGICRGVNPGVPQGPHMNSPIFVPDA